MYFNLPIINAFSNYHIISSIYHLTSSTDYLKSSTYHLCFLYLRSIFHLTIIYYHLTLIIYLSSADVKTKCLQGRIKQSACNSYRRIKRRITEVFQDWINDRLILILICSIAMIDK